MSISIMTLVWKTSLPTGQKMVLLALADNCNDQGVCYPSISMIKDKCSMSERSVFNHIDSMESVGIISRENRTGRSTVYTLHPCKFCTPANSAPLQRLHPTPATVAPPPLQRLHPTPATVAPITINESSIEPSKESSIKARAKPAHQILDVPSWVNKDNWILWQASKPKKSNIAQQQKQLEQLLSWRDTGIDYQYALSYSAMNGYQGLFEPKSKPQNQNLNPRGFEAHQAAALRDFERYSGIQQPQNINQLEAE